MAKSSQSAEPEKQRLGIAFGAMAAVQGRAGDRDALALVQRMADAVALLAIQGVLIDKETAAARRRLMRRIVRIARTAAAVDASASAPTAQERAHPGRMTGCAAKKHGKEKLAQPSAPRYNQYDEVYKQGLEWLNSL
jgi:hypothetical protein